MKEEKIINLFIELSDYLVRLTSLYQELDRIVTREHSAIEKSDFDMVEDLLVDKEKVGEGIVECTDRIMEFSRNLISCDDGRKTPLPFLGISGLHQSLISLSHSVEGQLEKSVFDHVSNKLQKEVERFFKVFKRVKPRVEQNRYIVSKLLSRQRQNIRLWQETMSSSEGTYNEGGSTPFTGQCSVIQIKA